MSGAVGLPDDGPLRTPRTSIGPCFGARGTAPIAAPPTAQCSATHCPSKTAPKHPITTLSRRRFTTLLAASAVVGAPSLRAQSANRLVLGQSTAFSGPAAQLGIQFYAGAKLYFRPAQCHGRRRPDIG